MPATGDAEADPRAALLMLGRRWGVPCDQGQTEALLRFGALLLEWNRRINLTGARSAGVLAAEHYPDAFALARRLEQPERLVDIGSGGGLPALPLALLRPGLVVRLCEPIAKKGAFLRTAIRELGLAGRVSLDSRRGEALVDESGEQFDVATSRATFEPQAWLALGRRLVRPGGRVFVLTVPGVELGGSSEVYGDGRRALIEVEV